MWSWTFWKKKFEKLFVWAGVTFVVLIMTGFFPMKIEKVIVVRDHTPLQAPIAVLEREPLEWHSRGGEGETGSRSMLPDIKEVRIPPRQEDPHDTGIQPVCIPPRGDMGNWQGGLAPVRIPGRQAPQCRWVWRGGVRVRVW